MTLIQDLVHEIEALKARVAELERPYDDSLAVFAQGVVPYADVNGQLTGDVTKLAFDAGNSRLGVNTNTPAGALHVVESDAGTTNVLAVRAIHRSSGTPAAGFGNTFRVQAHSSTNTDRSLGELEGTWATATDASRKARIRLLVYDTAVREGLRIEASGTAPTIGVLGAAASARITVTGSRGGNAALASLLTAMATFGWITDSTTV